MLLRALRRRRIRREPFPPGWELLLDEQFAHWARLGDDGRARLRDEIRFFIAERFWEGCAGLEMTERMQVIIAAQACLLLLGRPDLEFRNVSTILVYPSGYFAGPQPTPVLGGTPRVTDGAGTPVLGQAFDRGPVILSWRHAQAGASDAGDGENVVIHEFAHKLDMLNGAVDGQPPMSSREQARAWHRTMTDAYEKLASEARMRTRIGPWSGAPAPSAPIRPYALTNPAEFFAVATEVFFERGAALRAWDEELYGALAGFYRQEP
ncbi:MAG: M90 family metallopeptidase [Phycisphaerales bacterium]